MRRLCGFILAVVVLLMLTRWGFVIGAFIAGVALGYWWR